MESETTGSLVRIRETLLSFIRRGMVRSIGILVGGTIVGHAITLAAMPISTRLYTPEDFSALSVFSSIVGILTVIACLRFDAAIILPEKDDDAVNLLALSIIVAIGTAIATAGLMALLPYQVYGLLGAPGLLPYLWMIPIGVLIGGLYLAGQAWHVRTKRFSSVARSRALQATAGAGAQIAMGVGGIAPLGLLVGAVLNTGAGSVFLLSSAYTNARDLFQKISWRHMLRVARDYDKFPRYSVWEGIANGLSNSGPLIIIAAMAPGPEAGYLTLSLFALQAPMALLGNAVGQVYVSEAAIAYREGRLGRYTSDVLAGLAAAGAGPLLFAAVVSPFFFELIFGPYWGRSGVLVSWMAPWFFLQFLASPICNALHITGHQRAMMIFHIIGMTLRIGGVVAAGAYAVGFMSEIWAITGWLFYAGYLGTILVIVRLPSGSFRLFIRRAFPSALAGLTGGILCILGLHLIQ
ncbi:lipopolysaccharide biosynthesis protein [Sphingopyxis granuli]|uniref:lipopolysaccharide biosynthesis protein n=1 Tax=Sphingopyxis granuli TaxID=267128 RepID=UPI00301DBAB5